MSGLKFKVGTEKAARIAGVSRWTIGRKIKAGKLSCSRDRRGHPLIDLAELARVFALDDAEVAAALSELRSKEGSREGGVHSMLRSAHEQTEHSGATVAPSDDSKAAQAEIERLRAELERERADRLTAIERADRLEAERVEDRAERRELIATVRELTTRVALIEDKSQQSTEPKGGADVDVDEGKDREKSHREAPGLVDVIDQAAAAVLPKWLRR